MPGYVVVDFDEVKLKTPDCEPRSFFPGEPDKKNWVPIPWEESTFDLRRQTRAATIPVGAGLGDYALE